MLGKTVPEASSDGREFVCTAGYSPELRQAIRIYPMARLNCPPRWSICQIPLERNQKDSRLESWKIRGDRSIDHHKYINNVIKITGKVIGNDQKSIVDALAIDSIKEANIKRLSLCVILPKDIPTLSPESGKTAHMIPSPDLFGNTPILPVKMRFPWHPRIEFHDNDGKHNLMLRDWGCYELMRKHEDKPISYLEEALNLTTAPPLLCGNLNQHRTSWLVISIFQGYIHARPQVFDEEPNLFDLMFQNDTFSALLSLANGVR